jgi:hydroxypyruvate isomerase
MKKLTACIEWLYADETDDVAERVRLAAAGGLHGVEFHLWGGKPIEAIGAALADSGLPLTSLCAEPRRSLVNPAQHDEFLQAIAATLPVARRLHCPNVIVASGFSEAGVSIEEQRDNMVRVLGTAASMAEDAGARLLLEPLNDRVDHPGMFLCSTRLGLDVVEEVDSDGLRLLYDAYHSSVMGESPGDVLAGRMELVGHVQVADNPGRGAPGTGNVDWPSLLAVLDREGYTGMLGLEFKLAGQSTRDALALTRSALAA